MAPLHAFLPAFLPSFLLFALASSPALESASVHRQAFGSDNYYLSVAFSGLPGDLPARFTGSLVTEQGEFPVQGVRRKTRGAWVYEIRTPAGEFEGSWNGLGCPSFMSLIPKSDGFRGESLRAGACL